MENRYTVSAWHGESRSLFHVLDKQAPEEVQPFAIVTLHDHEKAREVAATLNAQAARIRELEGALRDLASYGERVKLDASTCDPAYWRQDIAHARRILEGGKP